MRRFNKSNSDGLLLFFTMGIIQCLKFFINTPITSVRKINTNNVRDEPVIHDVYDNVHAYFFERYSQYINALFNKIYHCRRSATVHKNANTSCYMTLKNIMGNVRRHGNSLLEVPH